MFKKMYGKHATFIFSSSSLSKERTLSNVVYVIRNSTAAKGQKIQITSTRKRTSSDIYQNLADNVRNMNLDAAILAYLHKMCEGGQK